MRREQVRAMAAIIRENRRDIGHPEGEVIFLSALISKLAARFQHEDPKFNIEKFIAQCNGWKTLELANSRVTIDKSNPVL